MTSHRRSGRVDLYTNMLLSKGVAGQKILLVGASPGFAELAEAAATKPSEGVVAEGAPDNTGHQDRHQVRVKRC